MTRSLYKIFLLMYWHLDVQIIFQSHGRFLLGKYENSAGEET
jgi:hypothetical protein